MEILEDALELQNLYCKATLTLLFCCPRYTHPLLWDNFMVLLQEVGLLLVHSGVAECLTMLQYTQNLATASG